jgi:hypothetical protein
MARTNLHELASRLLTTLAMSSKDSRFQGKLRTVATDAGLNSVRSAEAVKLLEQLGRIEVVQRGRRGRDTIIDLLSTEPVSLEQAEGMLPSRTARRSVKINHDDIGRQVVDRLLELGRDDALRAAQVEAFASEAEQARERISQLESKLAEAEDRETHLRVKLRAAEEALSRAEENVRRAIGGDATAQPKAPMPDEDARAVLDILRSGGI